MLSKLIAILICFSILPSCGNADTSPENNSSLTTSPPIDTMAANTQPLWQSGCYIMILKKDTARLNLHITDTIAAGHLTYNWYEKDDNIGEIKGVIKDSILDADYTFQSEGMTSVREVRFKVNDTAIWQATGNVTIVNNKVLYTDKNNLHYDSTQRFVKVPCIPNP